MFIRIIIKLNSFKRGSLKLTSYYRGMLNWEKGRGGSTNSSVGRGGGGVLGRILQGGLVRGNFPTDKQNKNKKPQVKPQDRMEKFSCLMPCIRVFGVS